MQRREFLKTASIAGLSGLGGTTHVSAQQTPDTSMPAAPTAEHNSAPLQQMLSASAQKHKCVGASAALYQQGKWETGVSGVANLATGVEVTPDTIFHIGSITKIFNTTLLMTLVDDGKVELDKPFLHYLPEVRTADMDALRKVTVAMLVNHTSGIDGELLPDHGPDKERIADAIPRFASMGQVHEPGKDMSYCNTATVLAGYLCQKVLDKSWYELIAERIYQPLDMQHAIVEPEDALLYRASVGHYFNPESGEPFRTNQTFLPLSFAPAGATAMMSATNLVQFGMMHANDGVGLNGARVLSPAAAQLMRQQTASYKGPRGGFACGLGWLIDGSGMVNHGGGGPGILSWFYVHPASKSAIAVLTNTINGSEVASEVTAPFAAAHGAEPVGAEVARLTAAATDAPVDGREYVGSYGNNSMAIRVLQQGSKLNATITTAIGGYTDMPGEPVETQLRPVADAKDVFVGKLGVIQFVNPDGDGKFQHLATGGRLYKRIAGEIS